MELPISIIVTYFHLSCPLSQFSGVVRCFTQVQEDSSIITTWQVNLPMVLGSPIEFVADTVQEVKDRVVELIRNHVNSALDLAMLVPLG